MARMERRMNEMCMIMKRSLLLERVITFTDDFARLLSKDFAKAGAAA